MMKRSLLILAFLLSSCSYEQPATQAPAPSAKPPAPPVVAQESLPPAKGVIPTSVPAVKIALLVPLSGESLPVGSAMMDAATLAIHDSYGNTPSDQVKAQVILVPKDTGNTPADSARVAKQAIDQGVKFIIGPLFSQSVKAVAPIAKEAGVSVLSFSNNKAVASEGIYTFGFLPEQQAERIVEYAYLHNLTRVALLAPNDSYGEKIQEALMHEFSRRGGIVAPSELYAPSPANIDAAVSRLAASYNNYGEERKFQAIFIADSGFQLKNVINSLKKTNIDLAKMKLLGTGLWDDPTIAQIPEMRGSWFPSAPPGPYEKFEKHFTATYGYKPVRLASLAYDAVMLATSIAMSSEGGNITNAALTDPNGYIGAANSLYRLRADGTSDRKLCIMEVTNEGFKVIDQAPKIFDK